MCVNYTVDKKRNMSAEIVLKLVFSTTPKTLFVALVKTARLAVGEDK
jgi:hypothetical protein